jgi:hypothetical protein
MKTYKITASMLKFYVATIEAESEEQAFTMAKDMTGSDFEPVRGQFADAFGDWTIQNIEKVTQ